MIPIHEELRAALEALRAAWPERARAGQPVVFSERGTGLFGPSSHSGRRTLLTNLARRCAQAGASLRDVQRIAGHADLGTTERYVEPQRCQAVWLRAKGQFRMAVAENVT